MTVIVRAKNGDPTIVRDGAYLLSSYDPRREMERFIDRSVPNQDDRKFYVLFGSVLGYGLEILLKRGVPAGDIFIYECDPVCLEFFRKAYPDFQVLTGSRIDPGPFEKRMMERKRPCILSPESIIKAYPDDYSSFTASVARAVGIAAENIKVSSFFSKVWFINFARNLSLVVRDGGVFYLERGAAVTGAPVLVAAAGPSLDGAISEIRRSSGGLIIISVLAAAPCLLDEGIRPDFIVVSDAGVYNKLHAAGGAAGAAAGGGAVAWTNLPRDIPVLASVFASSALLHSLPNKRIFYDLEEGIAGDEYMLKNPSVTIDAGMLARSISSGPVIFAGFDLAYSAMAGSHSRGNAFEEYYRNRSDRLRTVMGRRTDFLERKDIIPLGKKDLYTTRQFLLVKETAERLFGGCYSMSDGVEFFSLASIREIKGRKNTVADKEGALLDMGNRFCRDAGVMERIGAFVGKIKDDFRSGRTGFCGRIFVREYMGGTDLEEYNHAYERKMNILFD